MRSIRALLSRSFRRSVHCKRMVHFKPLESVPSANSQSDGQGRRKLLRWYVKGTDPLRAEERLLTVDRKASSYHVRSPLTGKMVRLPLEMDGLLMVDEEVIEIETIQ